LRESIRRTEELNDHITNLIHGVKIMTFFVKAFVTEVDLLTDVQQVDPTFQNIMRDVKAIFYDVMGLIHTNTNIFAITSSGVPRTISELNNMFDQTVSAGVISPLTARMQALSDAAGKVTPKYFCSQSYMKFWWNKLHMMKIIIPEDVDAPRTREDEGYVLYTNNGGLQNMYRYADRYWMRYNKSASEWLARTDQRAARHRQPAPVGGRPDWQQGNHVGHGPNDPRDSDAARRRGNNTQRGRGRDRHHGQNGHICIHV